MERSYSVNATAKMKAQEKDKAIDAYPTRNPGEVIKSKIAFLLIGMGMSMCWYSISAAIPYWTEEYGKDMYRYLLIAYNVAALTIVLAQTWDDHYNDRFGTALTYAFRILVAGFILLACEIALPLLPHNTLIVLLVVAVAGLFDSVGFGAVTQLASLYPPGTSGYVFLGQSLCSIFLLILTVSIKFGADDTDTQLYQWFYSSSAMIFTCAICGYFYLATLGLYHHVCDYKEQFDGYSRLLEQTGLSAVKNIPGQAPSKNSINESSQQRNGPILHNDIQSFHFGELSFPVQKEHTSEYSTPNSSSSSSADTNVENRSNLIEDINVVLSQTKGLQTNIILCWISTLLVQSMFTHVPSTNDDALLSQILVYVSLFGTFVGQQLNLVVSKPFHTFLNITIALWVRAFSMFFYCFYLSQALGFLNDYVIIIYSVFFFVSGGFFTSQLYGMIAEAVPVSSRTMAISLTNVSLMIGIVVGILSTLGVSAALD